MTITNVFDDQAHRELAIDVLRTAADSVNIELAGVEFGQRNSEEPYSWLCYVVDPAEDDRVARITGSSAADHFELMNPNGFLRQAGGRIEATIFDAKLSGEASILVRGDNGEPVVFSPWVSNLAVARVTFNYRSAAQSD